MNTITSVTNERTETRTVDRVHVGDVPDEPGLNYRLETQWGTLLYECQTLNFNGVHVTHLPPGTEIGSSPDAEITLIYDPDFREYGHVWIFLDAAEHISRR